MEEQPERMLWYGSGLHNRSPIGIVTNLGKILTYIDLFRMTTPIAHRRHKCCECKKRIERRQWYQLIVGVWDGEVWARFMTCMACADMRSDVARHYQEGIPFGGLHEYLAAEVEGVLSEPGGTA